MADLGDITRGWGESAEAAFHTAGCMIVGMFTFALGCLVVAVVAIVSR